MATHGLLLTLGGAPETKHRITIPDSEAPGVDGFLPGEYHPSIPTPIDDVPGMTLERARRLDADPSVHLKLVSLGAAAEKAAAKAAEQAAAAALEAEENAAAEALAAEAAALAEAEAAQSASESNETGE